MSFDPQTHEEYNQLVGLTVYGADDERIGTIDQVLHPADNDAMPQAKGKHYFLVQAGPLGGLLGTSELYIPEQAIQMVGADRVIVDVPKDQVKEKGWTKPPTGAYE